MKMKLIAVVLSGLVLGGCGTDKDIELVQNSPSDFDQSYSNLQILSNENFCTDLNWSKFQDKNQRTVVEATCNLGDPSKTYKELISKAKVQADLRLAEQSKREVMRYNDSVDYVKKYTTVRNAKELRDAQLGTEVSTYCNADNRDDLVAFGMSNLTNPTPEERQAEFDAVMKKCADHFEKDVKKYGDIVAKTKANQPAINKAIESAVEDADDTAPNKILLKMQWLVSPTAKDAEDIFLGYAGTDTYYDDNLVSKNTIKTNLFRQQATNPSSSVIDKWSRITYTSPKTIVFDYVGHFMKVADAANASN